MKLARKLPAGMSPAGAAEDEWAPSVKTTIAAKNNRLIFPPRTGTRYSVSPASQSR
jgi:hypothetical protein